MKAPVGEDTVGEGPSAGDGAAFKGALCPFETLILTPAFKSDKGGFWFFMGDECVGK